MNLIVRAYQYVSYDFIVPFLTTITMASNQSARNARLRSLLNAVLRGERQVGTQGAMFLDAISAHSDPPACVNDIIASDKGLSSLQEAIRSDFSIPFINGSVTSFLHYLQAPALKLIGGGQFLVKILIAIVDPPIFWTQFVEAFRAGHLQEDSQLCFAWLLLQLIVSMPTEKIGPYRQVAEDKLTLHLLLSQPHPDGRAIGQKIEKVLSTSIAVRQPESGYSPGGRHDNDFADFREIAILPTPDEIKSTDRPFLRPSSALDDQETYDIRAALYLDNQFRLLREDMLYEMREELQTILGLSKGRNRRGLVVDGLSLFDVHYGAVGKRCKWGLALQSKNDISQLKGQKGAVKRKDYLMNNMQGKKILRHQSLVCLLADEEILAFPTINRDEELLAKEPPVIVLQFDGRRSISKTLLKLKTAKNIKLVQIDTAIFSYEPVLTALQQIRDLPLSREILFWEDGSGLDQLPLSSEMGELVRNIRRNPRQDLSRLLGSSNPITLDAAQGDSLLSGLTQTVSLIQGPPGTAKATILLLIY